MSVEGNRSWISLQPVVQILVPRLCAIRLTSVDAIADAGDLTINGQRENVMVMREVDGEDQTYVINLCDRQDMLTSPAYYLQQNDVIYVTPNSKKKREAKSAGNVFNQPSIWISLASLLTTITALIIR